MTLFLTDVTLDWVHVTVFLVGVTLRVTPYMTLHSDNRRMSEVIS